MLRYAQLKLTFMDGKVQLNRSNLFLKVFAYYMANKDELAGKTLTEVLAVMFLDCLDCLVRKYEVQCL